MSRAEPQATTGGPTGDHARPLLQLLGVTKSFGTHVALRNVTFAVAPGEVVGFVGLNGAGKTTSLRVLLGLLAPSSGRALVLGSPPRHRIGRFGVGALIDRPAFHAHMSAADGLRMFGSLAAASREAEPSSVPRVMDEFGVSSYAGRRFGELSAGMRQRLGLALAFLGEPKAVVLDEPTDGLDPEGVAVLRAAIRQRSKSGGAVLFSSHLLSEVEAIADRVVVIHRGSIVADEPQAGLRHASVFRVTFVDRAVAVEAHARLLALGFELDDEAPDDRSLRVMGTDGVAINKALSSDGIFAAELVSERRSLEDTFLRLTDGEPLGESK